MLAIVLQKNGIDRDFFPRIEKPPPSPKQLERRLRKVKKRIEKNPNDLKALVDQGVIYFFLGNDHIADSLNAFHSAWQDGALDKRIFYYSGILYEELSLFEESLKQYRRFLNHEPKDRQIRLRLAKLLFEMGRWDQAIGEYERLVEKNEKDVTSLINLGLATKEKFEQGQKQKKDLSEDLQQAIFYLAKAAEIQPELPEGIYLSLAKLYFWSNNYEKSISSCKAELKVATNQIETLNLMALAHEKLNQKKEALEVYEELAKKEPRNLRHRQKIRSLKSQLKIK